MTTGSAPAGPTRVSMNIPESRLLNGILALSSHWVLFLACSDVLCRYSGWISNSWFSCSTTGCETADIFPLPFPAVPSTEGKE